MADNNVKEVKKARPTEEKRIDRANKANAINSAKKTRIRTAVKAFKVAVDAEDVKLAEERLNVCISLINCAKSDGLYHRNSAARKVSSLTKLFNSIK